MNYGHSVRKCVCYCSLCPIPYSQISMSAVLTMEAATIPAPTLQAVSRVAATPDTHWPRMEGPAMVRRLVHALTVIIDPLS